MSGKLTPRAGDRVIVSAGLACERDECPDHPGVIQTSTGEVRYEATDKMPMVDVVLDSMINADNRVTAYRPERLTVVDREPVEWPEGWLGQPRVHDEDMLKFDRTIFYKSEFDRIRGPEGDYVAEHWDELMSDD